MWLWSKPLNGIPFWLVGEFTTHCKTCFSRDWDVHWGYELLNQGRVSPMHQHGLQVMSLLDGIARLRICTDCSLSATFRKACTTVDVAVLPLA